MIVVTLSFKHKAVVVRNASFIHNHPSKHFNDGPMIASIGNLPVFALRCIAPVLGRFIKVIRMHATRQAAARFIFYTGLTAYLIPVYRSVFSPV